MTNPGPPRQPTARVCLRTAPRNIGVAGHYVFQVGTDWGRGGAAVLIDNSDGSILSERVITDDVWWAYNWNDPDVFTTAFDLEVGDSFTLMWVGFEGCCGGSTTLRFSAEGGAYQPLTDTNFEPYTVALVPEPSTAALLLLGLAGLASRPTRSALAVERRDRHAAHPG